MTFYGREYTKNQVDSIRLKYIVSLITNRGVASHNFFVRTEGNIAYLHLLQILFSLLFCTYWESR